MEHFETLKAFSRHLTDEMAAYAVQQGWVDSGFAVRLRYNQSPKIRTSRGGIRFQNHKLEAWVSLALAEFCKRKFLDTAMQNVTPKYCEYAHIKADPTIGEFRHSDWRMHLGALIAHEVAHAIDHYDQYTRKVITVPEHAMKKAHSTVPIKPKARRGHAARWQYIYAKLRREFVNDGYCATLFQDSEASKSTTAAVAASANKPKKRNKKFISITKHRDNFEYTGYYHPETLARLGIAIKDKRLWNNEVVAYLQDDETGKLERFAVCYGKVEARNAILKTKGII